MTTLSPRPPYTQDELESLYPKTLKLQLVQIVRTIRRLPFLTYMQMERNRADDSFS